MITEKKYLGYQFVSIDEECPDIGSHWGKPKEVPDIVHRVIGFPDFDLKNQKRTLLVWKLICVPELSYQDRSYGTLRKGLDLCLQLST